MPLNKIGFQAVQRLGKQQYAINRELVPVV
jgi:hypothetical protein